MGQLYQQYLAAGPMAYTAALLRDMGVPQPEAQAAAFYGAMFLLYSVCDAAQDRPATLKLLDQCLAEEYGVQVDANMAVNVKGLMDLVDMLGGVTLELTAQEADYLNTHGNWGITSKGGWSLKEGENTLSGEEAMGYAMISKIGGEVGRIQRQRKVVAAMVEQAEKLSITQLYDLVERILGCVSTDMTDSEILGYIAEFAPLLAELQIIT
jgi:anionic cell wall polymer biosynthesis LytR-Cps2A-Psr (LCP) family protein